MLGVGTGEDPRCDSAFLELQARKSLAHIGVPGCRPHPLVVFQR
jgi:hypothetical protein